MTAAHSPTSTVTLITGANEGLGYEAARVLLAVGHTVLVGARDPDRGRRAAASSTPRSAEDHRARCAFARDRRGR
jgi:NAD(P)-dependent dehydrogenase (short-subunit alcohol dehydrogenase family)